MSQLFGWNLFFVDSLYVKRPNEKIDKVFWLMLVLEQDLFFSLCLYLNRTCMFVWCLHLSKIFLVLGACG